MMPPDTLEILRQVNGKIRSAIDRFRPERTHCLAIKPEDLSGLLGDLVRAGECLRKLADSPPQGPEWKEERSRYRSNLEELNLLLPDFHQRLQAEKSRLQIAQKHVNSAASWAGASRETL